jgi:aspartate/methionine/tyrosine aminotransferase
MNLPPFLLDQWLAAHEFADPPIRYNLASSCGPQWTHGQILELDDGELGARLRAIPVSYGPPEGARSLREQIARLHNVDPDWVVVTTGASEALSIVLCLTAGPGAAVALPNPGYPATEVLAKAWGIRLQPYDISRERGYELNAATISKVIDSATRLVIVNSPHNPTGAVISREEIQRLALELASKGIPLVADEVFHHLYFGECQSSAAGLENVIQIGDLSKSLSLPGLRLGWIIDSNFERRKRIIDARSYFTISSSPLMEAFATTALSKAERFIGRLREVASANLEQLSRFIAQHQDLLGWVKPRGGTLAFPWLKHGQDSRPLCESFARAGVLAVPGDCYGMPSHIRVGFGTCEPADFEQALRVMTKVVESIQLPR